MAGDHTDESLAAAYQVIAGRRVAFDTMAWQTPALGFTAQAFLLTIALAPDSSYAARLFSSGLALVVACLSVQLLKKHAHGELVDSLLLEQLEQRLGIHDALGVSPHSRLESRRTGLKRASGDPVRGGLLVDFPSHLLWLWGLGLFGGVSAVIFTITLVHESTLA